MQIWMILGDSIFLQKHWYLSRGFGGDIFVVVERVVSPMAASRRRHSALVLVTAILTSGSMWRHGDLWPTHRRPHGKGNCYVAPLF